MSDTSSCSSSSSSGMNTPESSTTSKMDVEEMINQLTLDEKVALTRACDMWHTTPIERLGIPSLRLSDGPNGVRGTKFFDSTPAACFPCGTGLGATWDTELLREVGNLLGLEAKAKGAHILLGPTVNMQRNPLGGRGFESFSEDPVLSGLIAAAYCNGVQDQHIIPSIKHFVCNDQEDKRMLVDINVSERALREIYLAPFMLAVRDANPGSFMTAYNKVNGTHCSENVHLLKEILREEWNWEGLVVSDWYGTYSTTEAIQAGLDLECPGPSRWRTMNLTHAVNSGKLDEGVLDARVRNVLKAVEKAQASGIIVGVPETTRDTPEDRLLLRRAAAESIVLLKNEENLLPFAKNKKIAVIGSNARVATFCGGGSASLNPYYSTSVLDAVNSKSGDVVYVEGPFSHREFSLLDNVLTDNRGNPGFTFRCYLEPPERLNRECIDTMYVRTTKFFLTDYSPPRLDSSLFWTEMEATLTPDVDGLWDFGLCCQGTAMLYIDGIEVVDNLTHQEPGNAFLGAGTKEVIGSISLKKGKEYTLLIQFGSAPTSKLVKKGVVTFRKGGVRLRGGPQIDVQATIANAVQVAEQADQVLIVAGLNGDWEVEGQDRADMSLPPHVNRMIESILAVRPDSAVVIQSGTPVAMPWACHAASVLQMWFGGNEGGNGLADVLFGDVNPSGKLPLTFPKRIQDSPAFLHAFSNKGRMLYGEDIYVGYRYYDAVDLAVEFPFGHGLSYTRFRTHNLQIVCKDDILSVSISLENTGNRAGAEVVQVYIAQKYPSIARPPKELKGFSKQFLQPSESAEVTIEIPMKYATSYWDDSVRKWTSDAGMYSVLVGDSSRADKFLIAGFEVNDTYSWSGI